MVEQVFFKRQSILGLRGAFGTVLQKYIEVKNRDCRVITADTSSSAGLSRLKISSPDMFVECGIAEQAAIGIATGLALEGEKVFVGSFAPFIVGRGWEQIRLASYMSANMTIFSFGAGIGLSYLGFTHCSLEDIDLVSSIPNTTIFEPSTPDGIFETLDECNLMPGIKYIRLTGDGPVHKNLFSDFTDFGKGVRLYKTNPVSTSVFVCSGYLASRMMEEMDNRGVNCNLITINKLHAPIADNLREACAVFDKIYCAHESYRNLIYPMISELNTDSEIYSIEPQKRFSKSGDFYFVSNILDFWNSITQAMED